MKKVPQISDTEFEVMKVVWKHAPISTNEVVEKVARITDWNDGTIRTLLARLVKKGVLSYEMEGRLYVYSPNVKEEEYLNIRGRSFLDKFYDGDLNSLVLSVVDGNSKSEEKLDALYETLKARKDGKKG